MNASEWEEVFEALPDEAFFEVVRHYIGPVRTPFHKPELIDRMEEFFSRESVVDAALRFIDSLDARLLTVIAFHGRPGESDIRGFAPDLKDSEFKGRILNLEERLLTFVKTDRSGRAYALTPLGKAALGSGRLGPGAVVGAGAVGAVPERIGWFDDNFLTAALGFLSEGIPLFRKEGGWRKKALETLAVRFPPLFRDGRGEDRMLLAGRGLIASGLIDRRDDALIPRLDAWRALEGLPAEERLNLLKARAAAGRTMAPEPAARGINAVTESLPEGLFFEAGKLADLFRLASGDGASCSPRGARRIIAHLELMDELHADEDGCLARPSRGNQGNDAPKLTITPVGDITLHPGMPLFCDLALAAEPGSSDVASSFRMVKGRFLDGLDRGVEPDRLFSGIERHSSRPVPENLLTIAGEWIAEYESTGLRLAAVFTAEGIARQIVGETGVLEPYALSKPAEGVWILDPAREAEWREALASIGIERIPPLRTPSGRTLPPAVRANDDSQPVLPWAGASVRHELVDYSWEYRPDDDISGILEGLRNRAGEIDISPEERGVFEERLERRLVLVPEQIRRDSWRYEVMSAKGLDYRGKIRLAEAAISSRNDRLEVTHAAGKDVVVDLIVPVKLDKDGDDHVLSGLLMPEEDAVSYKIRKIGFLRRIKTSLF